MNASSLSQASSVRHIAARRTTTMLNFLGSAPMAYALLIVLQACAIRGYWSAKDVTTGDTSSYFLTAIRWPENYEVNIAWSPLYTSLLGTFLGITHDSAQAILLHRLFIVFAASLLTLAVLRRLLPPGWAWLMAAWWTVLPINFNTLYEVHLFAVLPLLTVWLLLACSSKWAHGAALAVLGASVMLVRNEMSVPFALLLTYCVIREGVAWYRSRPREIGQLLRTTASFAIPLSLAVALCCFAYSRSIIKYPELSGSLRSKHTLNMAQVYAFGYQQRHPEWTKSPWTEYQELTLSHFGTELPSLKQMIARNPWAVARHFAWNLGLTWNGVQVLLFNATTGATNPDYAPVKFARTWVWAPTIVVLTCWTIGLVQLVRHRRFWWRAWLKRRTAVWVGMLAVAAVVPLVICTQRPRPSYLFGLSIMLMAWTGMCAFVIAHHLHVPRFLWRYAPLSAPLIILTVLALPQHFSRPHPHAEARPLAARLQQLSDFQTLYRNKSTKILQGEYAYEIRSYLGYGQCESHAYQALRNDWPSGMPLEEFLREQKFTAVFLDENTLGWLQTERAADAHQFLREESPAGWRVVGLSNVEGKRWRLYDCQPTVANEIAVAASGDATSR